MNKPYDHILFSLPEIQSKKKSWRRIKYTNIISIFSGQKWLDVTPITWIGRLKRYQ